MPSKRRNNGRNKKNRGHVKNVVCCTSNRLVPKDKAISKFVIREIIDASSKEDIKKQCGLAFDGYESEIEFPKMYHKLYYSISCAIHSRIVRGRSRETRRERTFKKKTKILQKPKDAQPKVAAPTVA